MPSQKYDFSTIPIVNTDPAYPYGHRTEFVNAGVSWAQTRKLVSSANASAADVDASDAPTAGQKIVVDDILVSADTAMRVDFKEETSGTVICAVYLPANGTVPFSPRGKLKLDTADKKLVVRASVAGNLRITVLFHSEA